MAKNAPNLAIPMTNSKCPYFFKIKHTDMNKTVKVLKIKNKAMCTVPCLKITAQKMARSEIHKK